MNRDAVSTLLGLVGALLGGLVGYLVFVWIIRQGLYALILPGAFMGLGCGLLARHVSTSRGVICGLAAVALGLLSEWREFPFNADSGFGYFLGHIHQLKPITLIMIGVGGLFGYWWGKESLPAPWKKS